MSAVVAPILVRSARICREVGLTSSETAGCVWRPATIAATIAKSRSPGLAEEPTTTWFTGSPSTSRTGTTFPGELGLAISGSSREVDLLLDVVRTGRVGEDLPEVVFAAL